MTLYRIKNWEKYYEISDTKKVQGPLQWVAVRTKTDGFGYLRLTQQKNRAELLAAWYLMLGIAAKQNREDRGRLARDGIPLTPDDMELLTRFPAQLFDNALVFFSDPKQGWLESETIGQHPIPSDGATKSSDLSGPTGQDRTGHTEQDRTLAQSVRAAGAAPASDSEWLVELSRNPAYTGINVSVEHGKMVAWCEAHRKQPTRRRFVNWLNRAERPMQVGQGRPAPRPAVPEPHGWKAYLNRTYPDAVYAVGGKSEAHEWSQLPTDVQTKLAGEIRRNEEAA